MTSVDLPRRQSGTEPQLLLTSLLGDFWYWRDEHVPSRALVRLLAEFGISADSARAAMRRLAARDLLTVRHVGRTTAYGIPPRTSEVVIERTHRMLSFGSDAPSWDGLWTVVAFSVPETERDVRSLVRARLRTLRFAALYDGVWVSPHDSADEARAVLAELGVGSATVFRACTVSPAGEAGDPVAAFPLDALAADYRRFADRYRPLLDVVERGAVTPAEALRLRTELRVDWRSFPESDPDLPAELLPPDWPRAEAQAIFLRIYDLLGPPAEQRFRQVLAETDPELAGLAGHHDSAEIARLFHSLGDRRAAADTPFERAARARRLRESMSGDRPEPGRGR